MGMLKKIGIGIAVIFAIIFVLGIAGASFTYMQTIMDTQVPTTTPPTTTLITKSVDEMLPTRAEIPTEFTIGKIENATMATAGFESGGKLSTYKIGEIVGTIAEVIDIKYTAYKFSSTDNAKLYYDNKISEIKQTGGYREIDVYNCFAYKKDYGFQASFGVSICLKNNIVYSVHVTSANTFESVDDYLKDATNLLNRKI